MEQFPVRYLINAPVSHWWCVYVIVQHIINGVQCCHVYYCSLSFLFPSGQLTKRDEDVQLIVSSHYSSSFSFLCNRTRLLTGWLDNSAFLWEYVSRRMSMAAFVPLVTTIHSWAGWAAVITDSNGSHLACHRTTYSEWQAMFGADVMLQIWHRSESSPDGIGETVLTYTVNMYNLLTFYLPFMRKKMKSIVKCTI